MFFSGKCDSIEKDAEIDDAYRLDEYFLLVNYDAVKMVVPYFQVPARESGKMKRFKISFIHLNFKLS